MKLVCIDDERLTLSMLVSMCLELPEIEEARGFQSAKEGLGFIEKNHVDICILDIDMPEMDGLTLAARIKEVRRGAAIIFVTGYSEFAVDAFALKASGYLLKPISKERLKAEIEYAVSNKLARLPSDIEIRTFGDFDLIVNGKTVNFERSKSKELLAYLVDRQGVSVSRRDAFSALYEDALYDRPMQKQFDVIVRSLRSTLTENGASEILEMKSGMLRVAPERFSCDLYSFLEGDVRAVNAYYGEYMSSYPWASFMEGYMSSKSYKA